MSDPNPDKVQTIINDVTEVQGIAAGILAVIPGAASFTAVESLIERLAVKALSAWANARGTPITSESILALMPIQDPLVPPTQ